MNLRDVVRDPSIHLAPALLTPTSAWHGHIPFAMFLVKTVSPSTLVELGTHKGDSYCSFCQAVREFSTSTTCFAVDSWLGDPHTGAYGEEVYQALREHHDPRYGQFSTLLRMAFDEALPRFTDQSIDLLHIDGYHTYEAVSHDFQNWLPKVSRRGIVLFHDIAVHGASFGVWKLWHRLRKSHPSFEFLHSGGLGVLFVGRELSEGAHELLEGFWTDPTGWRRVFALAGRRVGFLAKLRQAGLDLGRSFNERPRPPVSVIIVTHNSLEDLPELLESLVNTLRTEDEVIFIDNGSQDLTMDYLQGFLAARTSLQAQVLPSRFNLGYAAAVSLGVQEAKNELLIVLNPDTEIHNDWIDRLVEPLVRDATVGAVGPVSNFAAGIQNVQHYLSKDVVLEDAWKVDLQLRRLYKGQEVQSGALVGFCLATRKSVLLEVGGLDDELFFGNDDLDLSFRMSKAGYRQLVLPSVFVRHKGQGSSRANGSVRTSYLAQQSANQLHEKLELMTDDLRGLPRVPWFTPQRELTSIVIPVHADAEGTERCLASIFRNTRRPIEVIVVNNDADAQTRRVIERFEAEHRNLKVIHNAENVGYPRACNQGIEAANGDYVVVMNNDVVVPRYWLSRILAAFSLSDDVGAVGPVTDNATGHQGVGNVIDRGQDVDDFARKWHLSYAGTLYSTRRLIGFLLALRRSAIEAVGGFDPLFGVGNFEDDDYSLRLLLAGWQLVVAQDVFVHHMGSRSFSRNPDRYAQLLDVNGQLFSAKWQVPLTNGAYQPERVLRRAGYRRADIYIPLAFHDVFGSNGSVLDIGAQGATVFLCVPDPSDADETWIDCIGNYLRAFPRNGRTSLLVRVEPTTYEWYARVVEGIRKAAASVGVELSDAQDVIVEARRIRSRDRGSVYRAATFYIPLAGVRRNTLVMEAAACGLQVLQDHYLDTLRRAGRHLVQ